LRPELLSHVPDPLLNVICRPVALPRSMSRRYQPAQPVIAAIATPGAVVQTPPDGA
jgi:hypothetical protein